MEPGEFRKLHVHLPRQPLVNQRPWWIAGLLLAFIILMVAAWSYYTHTKRTTLSEGQRKINYESER
jgi:type VI protein secretion system component VasF